MKQTRIQKHYNNIVVEDLLLMYNCQNIMQLPKIDRAVLSTSSKNFLLEKQNMINSFVTCLLAGGQKSAPTRAQKSISVFQLRKGSIIGCVLTMRKNRAYALLDKIVSFILPCLQNQPAKKEKDISSKRQAYLIENTLCKIRKSKEMLSRKASKAGGVPVLKVGDVARVQSPSSWLCAEEQRHVSFGLKESTLLPEIESLFSASMIAQKSKAFAAQPALKAPAYKQILSALQGLNILFSFCTHKSQRRMAKDAFNKISQNQQHSLKAQVVKQLKCADTKKKGKHIFLLAEQKRASNIKTERQKDLLFLSAFQYPVQFF